VNRSWFEPVQTGLVTAKDRKRPVHTGLVRFFAGFGMARTGLGRCGVDGRCVVGGSTCRVAVGCTRGC